MRDVSIIIPAYNEAERLPRSIETLTEFAEGRNIGQIIFVDDGSTDATPAILSEAEETHPIVELVTYQPNAGKGYAIRRGIFEATGSHVLISDADLSTPLSELDKLLPMSGSVEMVIGSRAVDETTVKLAQPAYRQRMGKTFNALMRAITGLDFSDTQCGFKLIETEAAKTIARSAIVDRFAWDVEFLMLACREDFAIAEVPVLWFNSPESRVRVIRDSLKMLTDLIAMRRRIGKVSCRKVEPA